MIKTGYFYTWVFITLVCFFTVKVEAEPGVRLNLEKETQEKVSLAITDFIFNGAGSDIRGLGKEARRILEQDLTYSELFSLLRKPVFEQLERMERASSDMSYKNWRTIGAQWILKTEYRMISKGRGQIFDFRLYDALNKRMILGKRYKASSKLLRKIMHRFADEVVLQLTGKRGLAETQITFLGQKKMGVRKFIVWILTVTI